MTELERIAQLKQFVQRTFQLIGEERRCGAEGLIFPQTGEIIRQEERLILIECQRCSKDVLKQLFDVQREICPQRTRSQLTKLRKESINDRTIGNVQLMVTSLQNLMRFIARRFDQQNERF